MRGRRGTANAVTQIVSPWPGRRNDSRDRLPRRRLLAMTKRAGIIIPTVLIRIFTVPYFEFVCEIKFSRNAIGTQVIEEVKEKIKRISLPRGYSFWPVLIHVNGVADAVVDSDYFCNIIDFSALLNDEK